jgi:hypothetical protein
VAGKEETGHFLYIGYEYCQDENGIYINQNEYIRTMDHGSISPHRASQKHDQLNGKELTSLRQLVGKINWIVHGTRPDKAFAMIDLSTKLKNGKVEDLLSAMKVVRGLSQTETKIWFPQLSNNVQHYKLVLYTDASHANICEGTGSVGAYILFLSDTEKSCPIDWHASKIKRVVRSTLVAETLSLQQGFEAAYYISRILREMLGVDVPIQAVVDNKSVVESVYSTRMVNDKRLRIDIAALKENLGKDFDVKWCPGHEQLANVMTKHGTSGYQLLDILQSGKIY